MATVIEQMLAPAPTAPLSFCCDSPISSSLENAEDDDEIFIYPGASIKEDILARTQSSTAPSPAQLESIFAAASSGDLPLVKRLFKNALEMESVQPFGLANDASPRTGTPVLHAAASKGYCEIVTWLINDCGAMVDLEDREGETALHKAALSGHLDVVKYLLKNGADVHARDADGWTALHNACSKGYLDIVRWLCENGGATSEIEGVTGIDTRSKDGWTPLMNASSKGHLPVVHYLLSKHSANPLIRNRWGETAYDSAAAVFEVWICEVLSHAEARRWLQTSIQYNPFAIHTTVPLILYEFQKLDTRLKTVAMSGGRPKFSVSGFGRHGRFFPFRLKLPIPDSDTGAEFVDATRDSVHLPLRLNPWILPKPLPPDKVQDNTERSHFWLSDWTLDVTHPNVDVVEGWQYAHSFDDSADHWTAKPPVQLSRLLTGSTAVTLGLSSSSTKSRNRALSSSGSTPFLHSWVRRRRWVRIMRRRLDIPPLPFLEHDGSMYRLDSKGALVPYFDYSDNNRTDDDGQELSVMPSTILSSATDYVARSNLVGTQSPLQTQSAPTTSIEARRAIAKLERATTELQQGILCDEDNERKTRAEVLLKSFNIELGRRRLEAGAKGLLSSRRDEDDETDDSDDGEEFHYPVSTAESELLNSPSRAAESTACLGILSALPDLTPQLSHAPEFRVPTHEKKLDSQWTVLSSHSLHPKWEEDELVQNCRECQRCFNLLLRRHHCRKCGRIFCDRCSSYRVVLDPSEVAHDPSFLEIHRIREQGSHRVCGSCFDEVNTGLSGRFTKSRLLSFERISVDQNQLMRHQLSQSNYKSQISDLAQCPVCDCDLEALRERGDLHVKMCLDGETGKIPRTKKYFVYRLPSESSLKGIECVICMEGLVQGSIIARLNCFCSFHDACLSPWLQRGKSCPVHAR